MWQHGNINEHGSLVWHSTLVLSGGSDCYGWAVNGAGHQPCYLQCTHCKDIIIWLYTWLRGFGHAMLRASQVTVIKQDDVKQLHCFESPLDYVTQNPSRTSLTWYVTSQNHPESPRTVEVFGIVGHNWSARLLAEWKFCDDLAAPFPLPSIWFCEAYTMSIIAGPHFFSTGMLWLLWMRAILRQLSWALLFRGPLAIGPTPSRTRKMSWIVLVKSSQSCFLCLRFRVSVCGHGTRRPNTLTQTDWGLEMRAAVDAAICRCIASRIWYLSCPGLSRHTQSPLK